MQHKINARVLDQYATEYETRSTRWGEFGYPTWVMTALLYTKMDDRFHVQVLQDDQEIYGSLIVPQLPVDVAPADYVYGYLQMLAGALERGELERVRASISAVPYYSGYRPNDYLHAELATRAILDGYKVVGNPLNDEGEIVWIRENGDEESGPFFLMQYNFVEQQVDVQCWQITDDDILIWQERTGWDDLADIRDVVGYVQYAKHWIADMEAKMRPAQPPRRKAINGAVTKKARK